MLLGFITNLREGGGDVNLYLFIHMPDWPKLP